MILKELRKRREEAEGKIDCVPDWTDPAVTAPERGLLALLNAEIARRISRGPVEIDARDERRRTLALLMAFLAFDQLPIGSP